MPQPSDSELKEFLTGDVCAPLARELYDAFSESRFEDALSAFKKLIQQTTTQFSLSGTEVATDLNTNIATFALSNFDISRDSHLAQVKELSVTLDNEDNFNRINNEEPLNTFINEKITLLLTLQTAFTYKIAEKAKALAAAKEAESPAQGAMTNFNEAIAQEVRNASALQALRDNLIAVFDGLDQTLQGEKPEWKRTISLLKQQRDNYQQDPLKSRALNVSFGEMSAMQQELVDYFESNELPLPKQLVDNQALLEKHQLPQARALHLTQTYINEMRSRPPSPLFKRRHNKRLQALINIQQQLMTENTDETSLQTKLQAQLTIIERNQPSLKERPLFKALGSLFKKLFRGDKFHKETTTGRQQGLSRQLSQVGLFREASNLVETSFRGEHQQSADGTQPLLDSDNDSYNGPS